MADIDIIAAEPRHATGKGAARAARRAGYVPALIYGNKLDSLMVSVELRKIEQELHKPGFFVRLLDVEVDGKRHRVLPREVQLHPVTDVPIHVDFLRFSATRKITAAVPVHFLNEEEAPGLKRGGVLNIVRHEVEVFCTADNIPEAFEIDLTGLEIGDAIHASRITLAEGVEFAIAERDFTIATVAAPTVPIEEEEAEEAAAEAPAEGEAAPAEGEAGDEAE